jgi:acetyl esterase/lipase
VRRRGVPLRLTLARAKQRKIMELQLPLSACRRLGSLLPCVQSATAAAPASAIERRLPPLGGSLAEEHAAPLRARLKIVEEGLKACAEHPHYADVAIYTKAVRLALKFGEFYADNDDGRLGMQALDVAEQRLGELQQTAAKIDGVSTPSWCNAPGLVVRGYVSPLDGSVQPYGLEVPSEAVAPNAPPAPLFVWLHGRGDKNTDLASIMGWGERSAFPTSSFGATPPPGVIIMHAFGRHCLGFKWAGEVDVFEATDHVCTQYGIDEDRIALGGFSMGGAGAWHLGAHCPDRWCVVHPGAGFVLSDKAREYADEFWRRYDSTQSQTDFGAAARAPPYEKTLWGWYDVPDYARMLLNVPLVVYSGEHDAQMAPARWMEPVLAAEGLRFAHIVGPDKGHAYDEASLVEVLRRCNREIAAGKDRTAICSQHFH